MRSPSIARPHCRRFSNDDERFWAHASQGDGCWNWMGRLNHDGYGVLRWRGRQRLAHNASWELHFGPIPEGKRILHTCDNPPCTNPAHLYAGTQKDNARDLTIRGRAGNHKGAANGRAKLTETQVRVIRDRYAAGDVSQPDLAAEYGVATSLISMIVNRAVWSHI